jgi:hypothetical protein
MFLLGFFAFSQRGYHPKEDVRKGNNESLLCFVCVCVFFLGTNCTRPPCFFLTFIIPWQVFQDFKREREREKKKRTPEIASQSQQKTQQSRWKYISCKWKLWWSSHRRRVVQWWNGLEIRMLSNLLPLFEQLTMACFDWVCLEIAYPNFVNLCWWGMLWDSTFQFGAI